MQFPVVLILILSFALGLFASNDGLTTVVEWDPYSAIINGKRMFVYSGEFHYQRMPVPEMWLDIFQKFKANGLNTVSIYFFWSYHSAAKGVFDLRTSGKDVQRVLDYAKQAGLYVIARPGPYCNAETNGGGFALWMSDGSGGQLRTSNETYYNDWLPWIQEIDGVLKQNQITNGGPVIIQQIENELQETTHSPNNTLVIYMEQIEEAARNAGIVIPFSSNEKGERSESWSTDYENVGGAVNMYGLDSYPGGLSCTNPSSGFSVVRNYYQWFANYSYTQPNFLPEFEGGYFTPWGGQFYDACVAEHEPQFADVYYKNNIGQRVTLQNLYMGWGGTNWGHSAAPVVYTSYDYSAPLRETRQVQNKFSQTKLIGLFVRVSEDLLVTDMAGNGTGYATDSDNTFTWEIRNPDNDAGFYVVQQNETPSTAAISFTVYLRTSAGNITVPNVQLDGRQSRIMVTDYNFGTGNSLLYSTADILTYGLFDVPVLVFYLYEGETGEFAFKKAGSFKQYGTSINITTTTGTGNSSSTFTKYTWIQGNGATALKFSSGLVVYLLDMPTAWTFFAPPTTPDPNVGANDQIFVIGPYLVRDANVFGGTVYVTGDNANDTSIEVYVSNPGVRTINWNGQYLQTSMTPYGSLIAKCNGAAGRTVNLPTLTGWRVNDSLPEAQPSYDDSKWTVCNKTTTLSPVAPLTRPVLFSSDYGYYTGAKIYRGYFDGTTATGANITASGGLAFGWNAWLNGKLVGGDPGNASLTTTSDYLDFSGATLYNKSNVLTVVVDYHGHDETSTAYGVENPRGILGAVLHEGNGTLNFSEWKIQGNAGGSANIDPVRGPMNEGGLYGERLGWHLPGFDASKWQSGSPLQGLSKSGINFYVTTFRLDLDEDLDVPIGVQFNSPAGTVARVMFFINGYQYGKYEPQIGPQTAFPVPPGVLNNRGENTIAISLWAQTDAGAQLSELSLFTYGVYQSSFDFNQDWSYLQPGWTPERLQYA